MWGEKKQEAEAWEVHMLFTWLLQLTKPLWPTGFLSIKRKSTLPQPNESNIYIFYHPHFTNEEIRSENLNSVHGPRVTFRRKKLLSLHFLYKMGIIRWDHNTKANMIPTLIWLEVCSMYLFSLLVPLNQGSTLFFLTEPIFQVKWVSSLEYIWKWKETFFPADRFWTVLVC